MHEHVCTAHGCEISAGEKPPLRCEPFGDERRCVVLSRVIRAGSKRDLQTSIKRDVYAIKAAYA